MPELALTAEADRRPGLDIRGSIATIHLRNPAYGNRLSPDDLMALRAHLQEVNAREEVLVLRIISSGKYFCSGYDISALAGEDSPSSLFFGETMDLLENVHPVTIAAVQGGAYGGGTDLCLACDFRIGTPDTNMFMPATRLGLHFYAGGLRRYISRLGLNAAKSLFLKAEKIEANQMLDIGFLTELVPAEDLLGRVDALSDQLAGMSPLALMGNKRDMNSIAAGTLDYAENVRAVLISEASGDMREGIRALKEKRPPRFSKSSA